MSVIIANATAIPGSHSETGTILIAICTDISAARPDSKITTSLTRGHLRTHMEMYMTHEHHSASAVYSFGMSGIAPTVSIESPFVKILPEALLDGVAEIRG